MLLGHGGNTGKDGLIDFSSNINPLGLSYRIQNLFHRNKRIIIDYPDPECISVRRALSDYAGVAKDNILVGNGSNELVHLIPRALGCSSVLIYKPTFSEYELSATLAKAKSCFLFASEKNEFQPDIRKIFNFVKKVNLIILCNPNNPTGYLFKKDILLNLAAYCAKNKTYLFIDEVFMEFVENEGRASLKREIKNNKYLLILRSLTKFFGLPGLRIGYLLADTNLINKISLFQPTWSVNSIAQETAITSLSDLKFIRKAKKFMIQEKKFLFNKLKQVKGIHPFYPNANFIFSKILDRRLNSRSLHLSLIKYGILIRDCSNFDGLDNRFFRVAVKQRRDNLYLFNCLQKIFR